ncbi:MAG TPA: hypothetical protein VMY78_18230 [Solirubrobacteraceae bacterium]|nr:hypothetical protein [Solirubrobacteraceae bacterium]
MGVEVDVRGAHELLARLADRLRLALDDDVKPAGRTRRVQPVGVGHEDLQAALVGVLGVVEADRVPASGPKQRVGVCGNRAQDQFLRRAAAPPAPLLVVHPRFPRSRSPLGPFLL